MITNNGNPIAMPPPGRKVSVREIIMEFAQLAQVPEDLALTNVLAAIACACQGLIDVAYPDGSPMPVSLIMFTVAGSGEGKTPVQKLAFQAIARFEQARRQPYDLRAFEDYSAAFDVWETKRKAFRSSVVQLIKKGKDSAKLEEVLRSHLREEPKRPRGTKILYDDLTPSGLIIKLSENWPYACVNNTDAADALFGSSFEDLTLFNKLSDGDSVVRDRASSASLELHGARLTINVAVQPESCRKFIERQGGFARNSGFLPRAGIVMPASRVGTRNVATRSNAISNLSMSFDMRITELLQRLAVGIESGNLRRTTVALSNHARQRWFAFAQDLEYRCAPGRDFADLKEHASKMPAIVLRIAALLEYFEVESTMIELDSLETAINCGYGFMQSAREVYATGPTETEQAQLDAKMLDWLCKYTAGVSAVRRGDIGAVCPAAFRGKKSLIDETLNRLVAAGLVLHFAAPRGVVSYLPFMPQGHGTGGPT